MDALGLKHWDSKRDIVIGADGLKSGFESIKANQLTATIKLGAVERDNYAIETAFWNIVYGFVPPKVLDVRTFVVDKSLAYVSWALGAPKI